MPVLPAIVIDTREQTPYEFAGSVRGTLKAGDYSLAGFETRAAIERKSLADAYGSIGGERARFEREWKALARLEYAAVVIESTLAGFLDPPPHTRMNPRVALLSYLAWHVKYRVPIFFAGDRRHAAALVHRLLHYFWVYTGRGQGGEAIDRNDAEATRQTGGRAGQRAGEVGGAVPGA